MNKKRKAQIKRIILITVAVVGVVMTLMVYSVLGPLRSFFWSLPYLSGFLGPRHYLILIQNNNELRPTGGFITAVAELTMLFGVPSLEVFDSYQVPNPSPKVPAPEPFEYLIGRNDPFFAGWTVRDANYSPDLVTSSQDVLQLFKAAYPDKDFDMVVMVDFSVIERLLDLYGPITVQDLSFTKENFFDLSQKVSKDVDTHDTTALGQRKSVLAPFGREVIKHIVGTPTKWGKLCEAIATLIHEKHLQATSHSESFQEKLENEGLSTRITPPPPHQDYLHLNVANIGGRKADRYVTKDIKYRADFSNPEDPISKLEVTFEHLGSYNIQSDIYQAYVRSYIPLGSEVVSTSKTGLRSPDIYQELGLSVIGDAIRIKPGEKVTLSYQYRLPKDVDTENYSLSVIKQPGVQNQYWQVALKQPNDRLMENITSETSNEPMTIRENLALWKGIPESDLNFNVTTLSDVSPPIILWQEFESFKRINVRFNEQLNPEIAGDRSNYELTDLNTANQSTDTITIMYAQFQDRDLWLTVEGVTNQPEEFYQLTIKNLQDTQGNTIDPNPLTRTLVQRLTQTP